MSTQSQSQHKLPLVIDGQVYPNPNSISAKRALKKLEENEHAHKKKRTNTSLLSTITPIKTPSTHQTQNESQESNLRNCINRYITNGQKEMKFYQPSSITPNNNTISETFSTPMFEPGTEKRGFDFDENKKNKFITSSSNSHVENFDTSNVELLHYVTLLPEIPPTPYAPIALQADRLRQPSHSDPRVPKSIRGATSKMIPAETSKDGIRCNGCLKCMSECHQVVYGTYCVKRTMEYFHEENEQMSAESVVDYFRFTYSEALRFQIHDATRILDQRLKFDPPECIIRCSLKFVVDVVHWKQKVAYYESLGSDIRLRHFWSPKEHKVENLKDSSDNNSLDSN